MGNQHQNGALQCVGHIQAKITEAADNIDFDPIAINFWIKRLRKHSLGKVPMKFERDILRGCTEGAPS